MFNRLISVVAISVVLVSSIPTQAATPSNDCKKGAKCDQRRELTKKQTKVTDH